MNKFEALKTFMAWPPEHQRLCAEYWIETGEIETAQVWTTADKIKTVGELIQRDPIPSPGYQPKAAKVAAVAKRPARDGMRYSRDEVSEVDSHLSEGRSCYETAKIMDRKHPNQRTKHAWKQLADRIRGLGFKVMMDRAVDVEFK
jgi:hypothetical protein